MVFFFCNLDRQTYKDEDRISAVGVKFNWLDTATDEQGFRIFRAYTDSTGSLGQLIADVPIDSPSCGQQYVVFLSDFSFSSSRLVVVLMIR